jgi:hypothetical protein
MGLLEVKGSLFRVNGIPLKMVRPFAYKEICLGDEAPRFKGTPHVAEAVTSYLEEVVDGLLEDLKPVLEEYAADPKRAFLKLPLVRVKVKTSKTDPFKTCLPLMSGLFITSCDSGREHGVSHRQQPTVWQPV